MSSTGFYRAFEERHRGSRELIKKRLEVYLPFIAPLAQLYPPAAAAIDLGCGRGEWLELLARQEGFAPQGVDLDDGMLAACRERGLPAVRGDAIEHLRALADESQCVVSGFHLAEHIAFDDLEVLVVEALRVLKPGGLLILETPNPENIVVGTSSFYLDPTHLRPLPPPLLAFLPEHHGYARVKTLRLQEAPDLRDDRTPVGLMQVFDGVSPDYSVVAQKVAAPKVLERFDAAFAAPHGIALQELASRHDSAAEQRIAAFDERLATAEAHAAGMNAALARIAELQDRLLGATAELAQQQAHNRELEADAQRMRQRTEALEAEHRARSHELEASVQRLRQQVAALDAERNALRASWSWRVTAPLRWGSGLVIHNGTNPSGNAKKVADLAAGAVERPLVEAMRRVLRDPALAYRVNQRILRHPALHRRLLGIARRAGIMPGEPVRVATHESGERLERSSLTPYAREIHDHLERTLRGRPTEHA